MNYHFKGLADMVCAEVKPINHLNLKVPTPKFGEDEFGNYFASYTNKILAEVVDTSDKAIVEAIIKEATAQGVNELFLIDKEFIMSAIKHEIIRRKEAEITYGDIYADFRRRYPEMTTYVEDYRPAIDLYQTIVIWTRSNTYHYHYDTKTLELIDKKGEDT